MKALFWLPMVACACQFGSTDVSLGYHLDPGLDAAGAAGSAAALADCTLATLTGLSAYRTGDVGRLDGPLALTSRNEGQCARARGCTGAPGVVEASECDASRCQLWSTLEIESGWYVLTNAMNGGCLDVGNGSTVEGGVIQAFPCHARDNQRWQAICAGNDSWKIVAKQSQLLLSLQGTGSGAIVQQSADSGQVGGLWQITAHPHAYTELIPTSEATGQAWRHVELDPAAGWQSPAFDDAAWPESPGAFGHRYEAPWTPGTVWTEPEIWLRRSFLLAESPSLLDLRIFHNGPVEVYLNGELGYQGSSSVGYRIATIAGAARASLGMGENTVAVHCAKNTDESFGPYMDLGFGQLLWR